MKQCYNNRIYIILGEISADYSGTKNMYIFLYDGDFGKEIDGFRYGALLDNRRTSSLWVLHKEDVTDTHDCRCSINKLFGGKTGSKIMYRR